MARKNSSVNDKKKKVRKRHFRQNWRQIRAHLDEIFLETSSNTSNQSNEAEWHESNGQKYLEIEASDYYNLGLMEGKNLGPKIRALKLIIKAIGATTRSKGYSYSRFIEMAKGYEDAIPDQFLHHEKGVGTVIDEIQGMADSLRGISFEDIFVQNCFIDIVYGELIPFGANIPQEYEFGCTSFGAVKNPNNYQNSNTSNVKEGDRQVYIGQNFDFNLTFKPTLSFVLHKVAHHPRIFCLRMGGILSLPTGLNEWGHRVCINVVKSNVSGTYTIPTGILTRLSLAHARDAESAYNFACAFSAPNSFNIMLADNQKLISCETLPKEHIRYDVDSWFTSSNTFIAEEFQQYLTLPNYSKDRQNIAEKLIGEAYDDGFSRKDIIKILSTKPVICRTSKKITESRTLAFITNDYFGIGNPADDPRGFIPLDPLNIQFRDSKV
ncbi:MAG: C45 family autoproteolytic acyltransferase/hydrolase [Promethearchaeota archaeon]